MVSPIRLLFGVHAHQPVGNFPEVVEAAHSRCYRPFLRTLHRFPEFRFAAHFSGWLLDFLFERHPEDMALLKQMVARGQTEIFGGGECEPVLAAISSRDRRGQLDAFADKLERHFGKRPHGAWLTERVWEATVVPELVDAGIRYVTVDDYHFLCTGRRPEELHGYYTTEEDGRRLDLFPISEALRYRLPFSTAPEAVRFLEDLAQAGRDAAIYFDDIEKFGIWPETYEWVYERGWLGQFVTGTLASPHIRTTSYGDFHQAARTLGIVYLPSASYTEMGEWTLPAAAAAAYDELVAREKASGQLERHRPFLRGGIWRNFFSRYPEANWMHKRMLALSERLAAQAPGESELTAALYRAQANDAYWHGLFGGLYLPHLRRSVYANLLALEASLDASAPRPPCTSRDIDYDGHDEIFLAGDGIQAVVRDDGLAAVIELDHYGLRQNFADTLRRHEEHYHRKLLDVAAASSGAAPQGGIASAHDRVDFKDEVGPQDTVPDEAPRAIFVDRIIDAQGPRLVRDYRQRGELTFVHEEPGARLTKRILRRGRALFASYRVDGDAALAMECQINLAMPSADGFSGRYILIDGRIPCGFGQPLAQDDLIMLTLDDRHLKGGIVLHTSRPMALAAAPHRTVSQSEAGFEKVMQAVCLTLRFTATPDVSTIIALDLVADAIGMVG